MLAVLLLLLRECNTTGTDKEEVNDDDADIAFMKNRRWYLPVVVAAALIFYVRCLVVFLRRCGGEFFCAFWARVVKKKACFCVRVRRFFIAQLFFQRRRSDI